MDESPPKAVQWASAAAVASLGDDLLNLRLRATDATVGPIPSSEVEAGPLRTARTVVGGLLLYGPPAAVMVVMFGVTLLMGLYFLSPGETVARPANSHSADASQGAEKMAEELALHKTDDPAKRDVQSRSPRGVGSLGDVPSRLDAAKIQVNSATADVPAKIVSSLPKTAGEPSKVSERFDGIGHKIAELSAAAPIAERSISASPITPKRSHVARGDAFDPSRVPNAPGAPRPLGATAPSRPLND
jgi:hypothetical protein